jgi:hypothetical protein
MATKKCVCGKCTDKEIANGRDALIEMWGYLLDNYPEQLAPLTADDKSSALVSLLFNLCVGELQRHDDPAVRESMLIIAYRLETLAQTPADQLEAMAQYLSDQPRDAISRQ